MPVDSTRSIAYRRARFAARLPLDCLYTPTHFWLRQRSPGLWRVGFTPFATRMLGDLVELLWTAAAGEAVAIDQSIGSIEGFKAVAELYSLATGVFLGANVALDSDPTLLDNDPLDRGWLYEVQGQPPTTLLDAAGYVRRLDELIDQMLAHPQPDGGSCPLPGSPP